MVRFVAVAQCSHCRRSMGTSDDSTDLGEPETLGEGATADVDASVRVDIGPAADASTDPGEPEAVGEGAAADVDAPVSADIDLASVAEVCEAEALILAMLGDEATLLGGMVRQRGALSKRRTREARQLLRQVFSWETGPAPRDLDAGLLLVRHLDAMNHGGAAVLKGWGREVYRRMLMLWPMKIPCVDNIEYWDSALAVYIADDMAKERLDRVQSVLDTLQVQLDYLRTREEDPQEERRRAMRKMRSNLPLVEG